jgi:NAD(P)-dependent dehydrogenase (short-subunit alcohol dehydrogenase family)
MGRLDDKVALISGGASGIGAASARRFAQEGAKVMIADIDDAGGGAMVAEIGASAAFQHLDVTDRDQWTAAVASAEQAFGRLDILVNAAGIVFDGSVEDTSLADWRRMIAVNVDGTFFGCQAAAPAMRRAGYGSIINLSSVAGLKGNGQLCAYNASKGAVRVMTKAVAEGFALAGDPIRCNSLHPGVIDTPMLDTFFHGREELRQTWLAGKPLGRMGTADEIGAMVLFMASGESSFATGAEFVIDGGMTA